jgi:hypothetical protein
MFPETSVRNYQYSLRNRPEERGSYKAFQAVCSLTTDCNMKTVVFRDVTPRDRGIGIH